MTTLFEKYESLRLSIQNPHNLIGKKFYWSKSLVTGEKMEHTPRREFIIRSIPSSSIYYPMSEGPFVEYEYLVDRTKLTRPVKHIIDCATLVDD